MKKLAVCAVLMAIVAGISCQDIAINSISGVPEGRPGIDYPNLTEVPRKTTFFCRDRQPGFYADPSTRCQVWHWCDTFGIRHSFICPNMTLFNQKIRGCDWWYNVNCDLAVSQYVNNDELYKPGPIFKRLQQNHARIEASSSDDGAISDASNQDRLVTEEANAIHPTQRPVFHDSFFDITRPTFTPPAPSSPTTPVLSAQETVASVPTVPNAFNNNAGNQQQNVHFRPLRPFLRSFRPSTFAPIPENSAQNVDIVSLPTISQPPATPPQQRFFQTTQTPPQQPILIGFNRLTPQPAFHSPQNVQNTIQPTAFQRLPHQSFFRPSTPAHQIFQVSTTTQPSSSPSQFQPAIIPHQVNNQPGSQQFQPGSQGQQFFQTTPQPPLPQDNFPIQPETNNAGQQFQQSSFPQQQFHQKTTLQPHFTQSSTTQHIELSSTPQTQFQQHSTPQNSFQQPSIQPSQFGQHNTPQPQFGQHNTPQPQFGQHNTPQPQFQSHSTPQPQFGQPSTQPPRFGQNNTPQPQFGQHNTPQPQFGQHNTPQPQFGQHNTPQPQFQQPNTPQPQLNQFTTPPPQFHQTNIPQVQFRQFSNTKQFPVPSTPLQQSQPPNISQQPFHPTSSAQPSTTVETTSPRHQPRPPIVSEQTFQQQHSSTPADGLELNKIPNHQTNLVPSSTPGQTTTSSQQSSHQLVIQRASPQPIVTQTLQRGNQPFFKPAFRFFTPSSPPPPPPPPPPAPVTPQAEFTVQTSSFGAHSEGAPSSITANQASVTPDSQDVFSPEVTTAFQNFGNKVAADNNVVENIRPSPGTVPTTTTEAITTVKPPLPVPPTSNSFSVEVVPKLVASTVRPTFPAFRTTTPPRPQHNENDADFDPFAHLPFGARLPVIAKTAKTRNNDGSAGSAATNVEVSAKPPSQNEISNGRTAATITTPRPRRAFIITAPTQVQTVSTTTPSTTTSTEAVRTTSKSILAGKRRINRKRTSSTFPVTTYKPTNTFIPTSSQDFQSTTLTSDSGFIKFGDVVSNGDDSSSLGGTQKSIGNAAIN